MAGTSVLKLKVDDKEYNSSLKQAQQGLQHLGQALNNAGKSFTQVDKSVVDYVRALGQMETTSRTATGKLAEMKKTFTELSVVYKNITDEEKNSPFGKALATSLDQLKGRIGESKVQLDDINKSINGGGGLTGALDAVAGKFGLSIDQITKFGGVVGVTTTAVQVAKDAFFQSESGIDEWGRTVEGAKGAYSVFLDTLNNGNWSNFFQNLKAAIQGGRDLYDVFDRLGSIKSNNAAAIAVTQKEIAELRLAKQQGENVDAKLKAATERLAALQKQSVSAGMAAGSQSAFQTIRNGVNSVGGAGVNDATIKYAVDRIMKGGQGEFDKYKRNYDILQQRGMVTRTQTINDSQGGTYERQYKVFDINALTEEQQKQYAIAKAITEGETRIQQGIAAYAQAVSEGTSAAREEFKGNRYALQGASGGTTTTTKTHKATPQETAANKVKEAERTYAETLLKNSIRLEAGMDTTLEYKKRELSAQERLFDAYNDAYATYKDPAYKKASTEAAEKIKTLAGEVKAASDAQEAARKSARELDAAQRKLADAQQKLAEARATGSATAIYKAQKNVDKQQDVVSRLQNPTLPAKPQQPTGFDALKQTVQAEIKFDQMKVDETALHTLLQTALQNGLDNLTPDYAGLQERIAKGIDIPDSTWEELYDEINEKLKSMSIDPIEIPIETVEKDVKAITKAASMAADAVGNIGDAFNAIEDPAAKVMGTVMQAIASIALGFAQAASAKDTTASGWAWLAWLGAGTAALATTIATVHSLTGYAEGGMIKGNSYSGDNIGGLVDGSQLVGLNAGEIVLTAANQNMLAQNLQGGGGTVNVVGRVVGEDIFLSADRYARRSGRGGLLTGKNL